MSHGTTKTTLVVMGVSGVGKTSVATAVAAQLDAQFVEADDLHPQTNIAAMERGTPLTDDMRQPWLDRLATTISKIHADGANTVVVACSALRRAYRDQLRAKNPNIMLVHLTAPADLIRTRMAARRDHFMPATMLESQLETLERPRPDEPHITIDTQMPLDDIVGHIREACDRAPTTLHNANQ